MEAEALVEADVGRRGAHAHAAAAGLIELEQMIDQLCGIALAALRGVGGEVHQLALVRAGLQHHRLGHGLTAGEQHIHLALLQIAVDHLLTGIGIEQQVQIGLFAVGDAPDLLRSQLARRPVAAAQRNVALVAAQQNLLAVLDHPAAGHAGVERGLAAAPADGLDLLDGVRPGQQPLAALEEISLKIRAQSVADDGNVLIVYDGHQALHLRLGQKLGLVHDDAVVGGGIDCVQLLHIAARRAQSGARAHDALAVAVVQPGLEHQRVLSALVVVVLNHDGVGRLGRPHRAISKVELRHFAPSKVRSCTSFDVSRAQSCRTCKVWAFWIK